METYRNNYTIKNVRILNLMLIQIVVLLCFLSKEVSVKMGSFVNKSEF